MTTAALEARPRLSDRPPYPALARRVADAPPEKVGGRPEDGRHGEKRRASGVQALAVENLLDHATLERRETLKLSHPQVGDVEGGLDPVGDGLGHGEHIRHRRERSSTPSFLTGHNPLVNPERSRAANPVAQRIREHCLRTGKSLAQLSAEAGLSRSGVQKICDRLDKSLGDVGLDSLTGIARAMGVSLVWLLYGDNPPGAVLLRSLPGWAEAAREAAERFGADPAVVEAVGGWHLHEAPARVDGIFVAALTRVWRAGA